MKDSKEYSKKVGKLYRLMKANRSKIKKVTYDSVADALVYAIVSENMSDSSAEGAIKRFEDYFVDLNDLRVSRIEEIIEVLGEDTPVTRDTASRLNRTLKAVFDEHNSVNLESLKKMGKRPAKQALEAIDGSSQFVVNYCMLTSLQGHAIPLTKQMIEYLRNNELVHPEADEQVIEGFLTKRISSADAYEFYVLLRSESESPKINLEKKTTHKTKTTTAMKRKK